MMDHVALGYLMGCYRENESQALLCSSQWKEEGKMDTSTNKRNFSSALR